MTSLARYQKLVRTSLDLVTRSESCGSWLKAQNVAAGDVIYFNNSFVYRDGVKTAKAGHYLGLKVSADGSLDSRELMVGQPPHFNADFKVFSSRSSNLKAPIVLERGLKDQLKALGELIYLLIGPIDDTVECDVPLKHAPFRTLRFSPAARVPVTVSAEGLVVINTIRDPESIWAHLEEAARRAGLINGPLPVALEPRLAEGLEELENQAYSIVRIREGPAKRGAGSILQRVSTAMQEHITTYEHALRAWQRDRDKNGEALNTILRIAYNFASDASELLCLLVSVSDLKPAILWGTIGEQFMVADAFRRLPWSKSKKKPSLTVYQDLIGAARNRAFHNLFPFDRNIEVDLRGTSLRARRLRLFSQYAKRDANVFEYDDQELVHVLRRFTRAREVVVSSDFWARNLDVIKATARLVSGTDHVLKLLRHL